MSLNWGWPAWWTALSHVPWKTLKESCSATPLIARSVPFGIKKQQWRFDSMPEMNWDCKHSISRSICNIIVIDSVIMALVSLVISAKCEEKVFSVLHCVPFWHPSAQSPVVCTLPTWAFSCPCPYMAATPFPITLCLHLTHQTVAVPAARAPAQITTRQLIELFFSSQAGGHCKNIPTLEYGFLVQVRPN